MRIHINKNSYRYFLFVFQITFLSNLIIENKPFLTFFILYLCSTSYYIYLPEITFAFYSDLKQSILTTQKIKSVLINYQSQ